MEKVAVNTFVTRQIKGSGKTYSDKLTFNEIALDAQSQMAKKSYEDGSLRVNRRSNVAICRPNK